MPSKWRYKTQYGRSLTSTRRSRPRVSETNNPVFPRSKPPTGRVWRYHPGQYKQRPRGLVKKGKKGKAGVGFCWLRFIVQFIIILLLVLIVLLLLVVLCFLALLATRMPPRNTKQGKGAASKLVFV